MSPPFTLFVRPVDGTAPREAVPEDCSPLPLRIRTPCTRGMAKGRQPPPQKFDAPMSHFGRLSRRTDMTSFPNDNTPDVAVIGGGLAGLTAAALVARAGHSVRVYERRTQLGGLARSTTQDGFTFNQGPHAFYRGNAGERVLTDLGVTLDGGIPATKGKVVFDGTTHIAPAGAPTLLRTSALSLRDKVVVGGLLAKLPRLDAASFGETTVTEWVDHAVRGRARAGELLHALVRLATYVNDPDALSAEVAISQVQAALSTGVLYLDGGWQRVVDQLAQRPGVEIVHESVDTLPDARTVIVATGSPATTSTLTGRRYDVGPSAEASCVELGVDRSPTSDFILGGDVPFYFSNHSKVAKLAPRGQFRVAGAEYLRAGDEPDIDALHAFMALAGVSEDNVVVTRRLHRMTTVSAMAVAAAGGLRGRPKVTDTDSPEVFIAGDWVGGDGHLADASVASAEAAAHAAIRTLERVATT